MPMMRSLAYPAEKAQEEKRNNPSSYYIYRPISLPIARMFVYAGLSANHATGLALVAALAGLALLAAGMLLGGALALNLAYIFDQVDGNVARATGTTSRRGAWLDSLVGYLYFTFPLGALALGVAYAGPASRLLVLPEQAVTIALAVGFAGSAAIAFRKTAVSSARAGNGSFQAELAQRGGILRVPKTLNSFSLLLLLAAVLAGLTFEFLVLYGVYQVVLAAAVCFSVFRRLQHAD